MQSPRCPRYAIRGAVLLMLAVVLFGCRKEQRYPGFTLVGVDGNLSYFVDASTIRRATGAKQFSFVQLIENPTGEYDVGEAMVDCDSLVTIAEKPATMTANNILFRIRLNIPSQSRLSLISSVHRERIVLSLPAHPIAKKRSQRYKISQQISRRRVPIRPLTGLKLPRNQRLCRW